MWNNQNQQKSYDISKCIKICIRHNVLISVFIKCYLSGVDNKSAFFSICSFQRVDVIMTLLLRCVSADSCDHCLLQYPMLHDLPHPGIQENKHQTNQPYVNPSPLDKMAAVSQTTFSNAFSWMKTFVCWFKFHWTLFLTVQLTITQH